MGPVSAGACQGLASGVQASTLLHGADHIGDLIGIQSAYHVEKNPARPIDEVGLGEILQPVLQARKKMLQAGTPGRKKIIAYTTGSVGL